MGRCRGGRSFGWSADLDFTGPRIDVVFTVARERGYDVGVYDRRAKAGLSTLYRDGTELYPSSPPKAMMELYR